MSDSNMKHLENTDITSPKTQSVIDGILAEVVAPVAWNIQPVSSIANFEALPPAAKNREMKQVADTFASTGRNIFVHYVAPVLNKRREMLLASGIAKKKYHKTAAQLWPNTSQDEAFFWNEAARGLRQCMKQNILSPKECIIHAGRLNERQHYIWHADVVVATYLGLPHPKATASQPETNKERLESRMSYDKENVIDVEISLSTCSTLEKLSLKNAEISAVPSAEDKTALDSLSNTGHVNVSKDSITVLLGQGVKSHDQGELLDTLPDRFEYETNMLYGHFAHYNYDKVCKAEGKHQIAMLRQLADRLDNSGKILFYYYLVPRLCKQMFPPSNGETVTSKAAEVWRFLPGLEKDKWYHASSKLKT